MRATAHPSTVFTALRRECEDTDFQLNYEAGPKDTVNSLFRLVKAIHQALTEKTQKLVLRIEQRASSNEVISDFSYRLDGHQIMIIGN